MVVDVKSLYPNFYAEKKARRDEATLPLSSTLRDKRPATKAREHSITGNNNRSSFNNSPLKTHSHTKELLLSTNLPQFGARPKTMMTSSEARKKSNIVSLYPNQQSLESLHENFDEDKKKASDSGNLRQNVIRSADIEDFVSEITPRAASSTSLSLPKFYSPSKMQTIHVSPIGDIQAMIGLESRPRTRYARSRRASTKLEQLGKTETPTMIMRLSQSMPSLQTSKPLEHLRPQIDPALAACLQGAEDLEEMYHEKSNNTFFITEVDAKAAIEQQSIARRLAQGAFQLYGIGDFTSAINQLSSLLSTAEKKQDFAMMALCAHHIGMALKEDSQRIKWAIMMQKKCLEHAERVKDSLLEARAHKALGVAYYEIKDYRLALEHQEKALKIAQGGSDPELEGRIYANIGNLSSAQDNWEEALDAHKKDLAIAVRIDCIVGQARAHKNLSIVYNHLDQSSKQVGVDHANIAQSLSSDAFFRDVESHPNDSVGNIYTQITRHDYQIAELVANSLRDIIDQYKRERS